MDILELGTKTKKKVEVVISIRMASVTKVTGIVTRSMDREIIDTKTEIAILVSGERTTDTGKGPCSTTMAHFTEEDGKRASNKGEVCSILGTETPTMGNGFVGRCTVEGYW